MSLTFINTYQSCSHCNRLRWTIARVVLPDRAEDLCEGCFRLNMKPCEGSQLMGFLSVPRSGG